MSEIIYNLKAAKVPAAERQKFYAAAIEPFEYADCDTLHECCEDDKAFEKAWENIHKGEL